MPSRDIESLTTHGVCLTYVENLRRSGHSRLRFVREGAVFATRNLSLPPVGRSWGKQSVSGGWRITLRRRYHQVRAEDRVVLRRDHGGDDHVLALAPSDAVACLPVIALRYEWPNIPAIRRADQSIPNGHVLRTLLGRPRSRPPQGLFSAQAPCAVARLFDAHPLSRASLSRRARSFFRARAD